MVEDGDSDIDTETELETVNDNSLETEGLGESDIEWIVTEAI